MNIFNAILASGRFPIALKTAKIFIAKPNKDHHKPDNYWPISLPEVTGKVLEKSIYNRLNYYMKYNQIFTESLDSELSRGTQLATNVLDTVASLQKHGNLALITTRDVQSFWQCGTMDSNWSTSLTTTVSSSALYKTSYQPKIILSFNCKTAEPFIQTAGVPKGSCLSSILFNSYVNDLPQPEFNDTFITVCWSCYSCRSIRPGDWQV